MLNITSPQITRHVYVNDEYHNISIKCDSMRQAIAAYYRVLARVYENFQSIEQADPQRFNARVNGTSKHIWIEPIPFYPEGEES